MGYADDLYLQEMRYMNVSLVLLIFVSYLCDFSILYTVKTLVFRVFCS